MTLQAVAMVDYLESKKHGKSALITLGTCKIALSY